MKHSFAFCFLFLPLSSLAQGSSPSFRERAEADLRLELKEAIRTENWALVKEDADALEKLAKSKVEESKPKKIGTIQALRNAGLSLSRGPDNGDDKKGAIFAFTQDHAPGASTEFTGDFYLKWKKEVLEKIDTLSEFDFLAVSAQGKLSSKESSETDAWRFRLENEFFTQNRSADRLFDGFVARLSLKEESDRDFKLDRLSGELWLTANKRDWFIGQYSGTPDSRFIQLRWRPYVGVDVGGNISNSIEEQGSNSNLWLMTRGKLDIRLNFLLNILPLQDLVAYLDDKYVYLAGEDIGNNYLNAGIDLEWDDNVGFALEYTNGKDSPKFVHEEIFKGGFTIKF